MFAKGGTVNLKDSTVTTTANEAYGLQAFSAQLGEAETAITARNVNIHTKGVKAHGAFLYFEQVANRSATNLTIDDSSILTEGKQASGLLVGNTQPSQLKGDGALTVNNSTITTKGLEAIGLRSEHRGDAILNQSHIVTEKAIGVTVISGGTVTLDRSSIRADNAAGLVVDGSGSKATLTNTDVSGKGRGILVKNEGFVSLTGGTVQTGENTAESITVVAEEAATLKASGVTFIAESDGLGTGDLTSVIRATGVGTTVDLIGGHVINQSSEFGRGLLAGSSAVIKTDSVQISTAGDKSHAVHADGSTNALLVRPEIQLTGGTVHTSGDESTGIYSQRLSKITSSAIVTTEGRASFGAFAYGGGDIMVDGGEIHTSGGATTSGANAFGTFGVLSKKGSTIAVNNSIVTTTGDLAEGLRAEHESGVGSQITVHNSRVTTSGSQAHGVGVMGSGSTVTVTDSTIIASATDAYGAQLTGDASLVLNNTVVESGGASLSSVFTQAGQVQEITVGSGSNLTVNNGTLLLVERSGGDGGVTLTLQSGAYATGNVVNWDGDALGDGSNTAVINNGANWAGLEIDRNTNNETNVTDGQDITGNVAVSPGSNVTFNGNTFDSSVASGANSNISFSGNTEIGGNALGQSGSTLSFSGPSTIVGGVIGVGSNFRFNGSETQITGNVALGGGSMLSGGTVGTPIEIGGDVDVTGGSVLGGNLNVGGALSGTGGILGPGNSIGIQTYGALTDFTGTYIAEVDAAGRSDLIKIETGNADLSTLALRVGQASGNGGYLLNHDYTIIETVTGNIENEFSSFGLDSSLANTLAQLDPIKYGTQDVKISLSLNTAKVAAQNFTGNQSSVMSGLEGHASLMSAVATMQVEDAKNALNQLSGEVHGSTQSALHSSGGLLVSTIGNRMRGNVGAGMLAGAPTADASGSAVAGSMPRSAAYPLWAEVVGNWNTLDGDDNAAETKSHTAGIYVGGDTAVGNGWRVGGALGFTDGRIKADSVGSRSDVRSYTATVYGGNQWAAGNGQVNFLAGAGYTRHNIDSRRSINVGGSQTLKADYHANTVQLFTELGYAIPVGQVSTIEPYAGVAWSSQRTKDFTETGGSAALHGKGQTDDVTTLTLGLRGTTLMAVGQHDARLSAGLGWRHASGDVNANRTMSFVQGGGAAFTVAGAPIAKNAAVVDLGAEVDVGKNAAMGLAYSGQFGNGSTDSTGSLYLKVRF
ncbi:MAG: autotransporter domain-containing protein [Candidimonas sp.]|nr:autotransporter domain-containing protein [Candidimonas sp.]